MKNFSIAKMLQPNRPSNEQMFIQQAALPQLAHAAAAAAPAIKRAGQSRRLYDSAPLYSAPPYLNLFTDPLLSVDGDRRLHTSPVELLALSQALAAQRQNRYSNDVAHTAISRSYSSAESGDLDAPANRIYAVPYLGFSFSGGGDTAGQDTITATVTFNDMSRDVASGTQTLDQDMTGAVTNTFRLNICNELQGARHDNEFPFSGVACLHNELSNGSLAPTAAILANNANMYTVDASAVTTDFNSFSGVATGDGDFSFPISVEIDSLPSNVTVKVSAIIPGSVEWIHLMNILRSQVILDNANIAKSFGDVNKGCNC